MEWLMLDNELIGFWSADEMHGPGAQSDDCLIFKPDGTGRYEFLNWILCSADLFCWETPQPGVLRIVGVRNLQVSDDARSIEVEPSSFGTQEFYYEIKEEDTPSGDRMRVLRLPLPVPMQDSFGFARADLSGLEEPKFKLES
jgi:hypothetical protein